MDLTGTQIKNTYGNVITIGAAAGTPQTGTLQNGAGENITSATLTGGTVTTSNPLLDMTQTWNDAGVTFTSLKLNVTDTASGSSSLLLDLQVGGTAKAQILKDGRISSRKGYVYAKPQFFDGSISEGAGFQIGNSSSCHIYGNYNATFSVEDGANGIRIAGSFPLGFVNGHAIQGASDVRLYRDASYTLAQRVGTNAQTFNIYNTYTDGSNYERGFLKWNSNTLEIGTEALGTGTVRETKIFGGTNNNNVYVGTNGIFLVNNTTAQWYLDNSGNFKTLTNNVRDLGGNANRPKTVYAGTSVETPRLEVDNDFTVATLPTPTVGMIARVTDGDAALTFGNTVVNSGAGATPYLCWYNGSNWTVIGA